MQLLSLMVQGAKGAAEKVADGAGNFLLRFGRTGALLVALTQGHLQEAAFGRRLFYANTAPTGVAPGTSVGTTAAFALANPNGSGVTLVVHRVALGYVSGTLGAGHVAACVGPASLTAVSGTAIVATEAYGGGQSCKAKAFTTATLPAAPNVAIPVVNLGAKAAATALDPTSAVVEIRGGVVIPEGCSFSLQGVAAAGSSPLVVLGCAWEEVPA